MRVARAKGTRSGALAAIAPALLIVAWTWVAAWYQSIGELVIAVSVLAVIAILAGGIMGARIGPSVTGSVLGIVAYAAVAWLVFVPVGVARTVLGALGEGRMDASDLAITLFGGLAYGLVSSLYMVILLLPLGVVWVVAFRVLGRGAAR